MIDLFGLEKIGLVQEAVKAGDNNKITQFLGEQHMNSDSEPHLVRFLDVLETLPLLQIWGDNDISVSYRLGKIIKTDENGDFYETDKLLETVDISFDLDDRSWVDITYRISENGVPANGSVDISEQQSSSLRGPMQVITDRFVIYEETSSQYASGSGDVIRTREWRAILDGFPVSIVYRTKNAEANLDNVTTETFFANAAIYDIAHFTDRDVVRGEDAVS